MGCGCSSPEEGRGIPIRTRMACIAFVDDTILWTLRNDIAVREPPQPKDNKAMERSLERRNSHNALVQQTEHLLGGHLSANWPQVKHSPAPLSPWSMPVSPNSTSVEEDVESNSSSPTKRKRLGIPTLESVVDVERLVSDCKAFPVKKQQETATTSPVKSASRKYSVGGLQRNLVEYAVFREAPSLKPETSMQVAEEREIQYGGSVHRSYASPSLASATDSLASLHDAPETMPRDSTVPYPKVCLTPEMMSTYQKGIRKHITRLHIEEHNALINDDGATKLLTIQWLLEGEAWIDHYSLRTPVALATEDDSSKKPSQ